MTPHENELFYTTDACTASSELIHSSELKEVELVDCLHWYGLSDEILLIMKLI